MTLRDPRATPKRLMGDPGNDGAFVQLPSVCLFCARPLLPGDLRWFCHPCFQTHKLQPLHTLINPLAGDAGFSPQVTPVWALGEVTE